MENQEKLYNNDIHPSIGGKAEFRKEKKIMGKKRIICEQKAYVRKGERAMSGVPWHR